MAAPTTPLNDPRRPEEQTPRGDPAVDGTLGWWIQHVNTRAVAALACALCWFFGVTSVVAIVLARRARREIEASGGVQTGRGLARAATILGWLGVASMLLAIVAVVLNGLLFLGLSDHDAGPVELGPLP